MTSDGTPADITPATPPRRVVVGYDGSAGSRATLERAVDAAGDAGFVFVVHAYAPPRDGWGHPSPSLARPLHGSVTHDLIRLAHVPVTVVPRGTVARPAAEAA
jgi:nucleotide-binding universal stress UspA family protein